MTSSDVAKWLNENFNSPEGLEIRKKWSFAPPETSLPDVQKYFAMHPEEKLKFKAEFAALDDATVKGSLVNDYLKTQKNPFLKESINLTEQGKLYNSNRLVFNALKERAF